MILQDKIKIIAKQGNLRILRPIFGHNIELGKYYLFPIRKLSNGSHYGIKVKCDFCDFTREIKYKEYLINTKRDGKYYCSNCSPMKVENSKYEKYGDKHYGLEKGRNNILKLYGVENVFQLESVKKKARETKFIRYGDENYVNIEKHKETIMKLYGVDNISKSLIIKQKKIDTCLKNWGVEYPIQNKEILAKTIATIQKNRKYNLEDMQIYRYKVIQLTNKKKNELFDNWSGYDYYDNHHIANNFNLRPSDRQYPTVDHKISIFSCFMNKISIEYAASMDNLCITTKSNNSKKSRKNESDFII